MDYLLPEFEDQQRSPELSRRDLAVRAKELSGSRSPESGHCPDSISCREEQLGYTAG